MTDDDLCWRNAVELAGLIRDRKVSPVDVVKSLLARIERLEPQLNAFITVTGDSALAAARTAEAEAARGTFRGPLHGVPFGLKDVIDVRGVLTTGHSRILRDNIATEDAEVTRRLAAAGAILIGKNSTHEFAFGGPAFDLPWPPARNPWNRDRSPGGSSSGSAVAVTAGMVPAAIGTDTGGSIRNPATSCGIVGMKPSFGRISRHGVFPLSSSLDTIGLLTRDVAGNALLLNAISGHRPGEPGSADQPVPDFLGNIDRTIAGLKIGVIRHFYMRDMVAADEVSAAIEAALAVLAGLGAEVIDVETAPLREFTDCYKSIVPPEGAAIHEKWLKERPQDYAAITRAKLSPGFEVRAVDYLSALQKRQALKAQMDELARSVDVMVTASAMDQPFLIADQADMDRFQPRNARNPFSVTGHPALSLPIGFSAAGLPLAMQIAGRYWEESVIYQVAHAYEQATSWHDKRPPI